MLFLKFSLSFNEKSLLETILELFMNVFIDFDLIKNSDFVVVLFDKIKRKIGLKMNKSMAGLLVHIV